MADTPAVEASAPPSESLESPKPTESVSVTDAEPWKKSKHKLKIDGQEIEASWDEIIRDAQKGRSADKRYQEVALTRKQLQDAWNAANPDLFFKNKNIDPEKWAEELLIRKIQREKMSPEERAAEDKKAAAEADRQKERDELEALRKEKVSLVTQQYVQKLDDEISGAFKATGISPTPVMVKRMAEKMEAYMDQHDGELLPASEALKAVQAEFDSDFTGHLSGLTAKQLRAVLPKKLLDELRKEDVELVRSQSPLRNTQNGANKPSTPAAAKTNRVSTDDFFKRMEQKLG